MPVARKVGCKSCGKDVALTKAGTMRTHTRPSGKPCQNSGSKP